MKPDIQVCCPVCKEKAAFYSEKIIRFTLVVPDVNGKVVCGTCGLNRAHKFTPNDYYFAIPVGSRFLYARTMENLQDILSYFKENKKHLEDPELDFPKEFYKNKKRIVELLEKRIEKELEKTKAS